ncbi:MAG: tetratricopeptide repeat protein [Bacteroidaceae bacterium]|nr:tetratricopeptide repeat protein [Bacteroidaceae bacterium]
MEGLDNIVEKMNKGMVNEAIAELTSLIAQSETPSDTTYYILGNAYRKIGDWQHALDNYLQAIAINPDSPAKQAYTMAMDILNFYNKDMFNQ